MKQFVSRKFLLALLVIALASFAYYFMHMSDVTYGGILVACLGLYQGANAYDSRTDAIYTPPYNPPYNQPPGSQRAE